MTADYRLEVRSTGRDHRLVAYAQQQPGTGRWLVVHIGGGWHVLVTGSDQAAERLMEMARDAG